MSTEDAHQEHQEHQEHQDGNNSDTSTISDKDNDVQSSPPSHKYDEDVNLTEYQKELRVKKQHEKACKYLKNGDLERAESTFLDLISRTTAYFPDDKVRSAAAMHNVGIVRLRSGNLEGAKKSMGKAIVVRKKGLGKEHPKVADSLVEQGIILLSLEEFEDSIECFNEAIELRENEALESKNKVRQQKIQLQIAKILNNIGGVYFEYGDLDNATETYEEALELQRRNLTKKKKEKKNDAGFLAMASTICNISYIFLERNEWEDAIGSLSEVMEIQTDILDLDNVQILNTLENLGFAYAKFRNYDESIKTYKKVLQHYTDTKPCDNKAIMDTMGCIVFNHVRLCQYNKALKYLREMEKMLEASKHPNMTMMNEVRDLIHAANYEMLKFPGPLELMSRFLITGGVRNPLNQTLCKCTCVGSEIDEMDLKLCLPKRPEVIVKMSGHKIAFT